VGEADLSGASISGTSAGIQSRAGNGFDRRSARAPRQLDAKAATSNEFSILLLILAKL
jgi:hypothetical protein